MRTVIIIFRHELQKQLDAEINEQKRNSMYLEQYLKLLEEKVCILW